MEEDVVEDHTVGLGFSETPAKKRRKSLDTNEFNILRNIIDRRSKEASAALLHNKGGSALLKNK